MHDTKHFIYDCIIYMEYGLMFYVNHFMCILRGVALVGEFFYWVLLTTLWDPLSNTGGVQGDGAPTRP